MKKLFVFCVVLFLVISCSAPYYMKRGNIISETGRFHKASSKFEKAYNKSKTKPYQSSAAIRVGQEFEKVNQLSDAYSWYRRAERANDEQAEIYLKLAQICANMNDIEMARNYYNEYEELFSDGKGEDGLYHLQQTLTDSEKEGRYTVQLMKEFNSRNDDFSPIYFPGDSHQVYFSSTRKSNLKRRRIKIDPITGNGYSHIFRTDYVQEIRKVDKKGKVSVKRFAEPCWLAPILLRDSLLSNKHEGAMCFSADGEQMYLTSSRTIKGANVGTRIYKATKKSNEEEESELEKVKWTSVSLSGICGDSVSIGHPALSVDGNRMYFVSSELAGGFGGNDIWYVDLEGEKWGTAVNAGEMINTAGHEMFPYIRDNGEFYFSSNGRYGFGGLDLYKIEQKNGKEVVTHLPSPLNSYADDFGIVFKQGEEQGLLTSSRTGRSDDIYSFNFIPQQLSVKVLAVNNVTELPIVKVAVTVTADDGTVLYLETDSVGMATMPVTADKEYVFAAEHAQYLKGKGIISTYREKEDRLYNLVVSMQPIEKPIVIPNIYFDIAKWDLRPDAMANLSDLLEILHDNPNITMEISAHTDMIGNNKANRVLSENRARSVVEYLIEKGMYWDRLESKGYGETQPRQMNEKDVREYTFLKVGDVLSERFVNRLKGSNKEMSMQLNRRIEFKVLRTNYKPGPNSLHNPNQRAIAAEEGVEKKIGETQLRALSSLKGKLYTLQLGVFTNVPAFINQFKMVFTEQLKTGAVRYCVRVYDTREAAALAAKELKKKGIDCFVKELNQ